MPPAPEVRRQRPARALQRLLRDHLATFLERLGARGRTLPRFVRRELDAFLTCGDPSSGFARFRCDGPENQGGCGFERLVPFSCKGRGFCPSCGGRRMADTAAHLVDHVFRPGIPVRQWVLTLPFDLRYRLAYDPDLTTAVLAVYIRVVRSWLRRKTGRVGQAGVVTHIQRFGGAANANVHFHSLASDGVFRDENTAAFKQEAVANFVPAPAPTSGDVKKLLRTIRRRILRLLRRRGVDDYDALADDEPVLASTTAASLQQQRLFDPDAGGPTQRERWRVDPSEPGAPPLSARLQGFSLHAATRVRGDDRAGLERLCRYVARPPIPIDRLQRLDDGRYRLQLKRAWADGTRAFIFEPLDLIARLVALIPRPGKNLLRYHGAFAPNARRRAAVVPHHRDPPERPPPAKRPRRQPRRRVMLWAELLKRVYDVDPLDCPHCGGRLRLLALIDQPSVIRRILTHLGLPTKPPPLAPARAPPEQLDLGV